MVYGASHDLSDAVRFTASRWVALRLMMRRLAVWVQHLPRAAQSPDPPQMSSLPIRHRRSAFGQMYRYYGSNAVHYGYRCSRSVGQPQCSDQWQWHHRSPDPA